MNKNDDKKDTVYTVHKNDTLRAIARVYNTTVKKLQVLNNIADPDDIVIGQKIKLK